MGLDQYIYRVRKPKLEDKMYTHEEIDQLNLVKVSAIDFETNTNLYAQLTPYVVKRDVECDYYNVEKMIADYNLPENSHIVSWGTEGVELWGTNERGEHVKQQISEEEIFEKFVKTEVRPYYIWEEIEEHYWRKNYDLQDWIYNTIEGVDNTGYYILNVGLISDINYTYGANIPEEDPTEESALFYWEWY